MGETTGRTVADLGEFGLIEAIRSQQPAGSGVLLGAGDDAAVVAAPDGRVVISTDVLVEGVHFKGEWAPPEDIGRRAAAATLSDIAAMGASATALVVSLTGPSAMSENWALGLAKGLAEEAAVVGASVVGGDLSAGRQVGISVTGIGDLAGLAPVTRAGARSGDVVALAGRQGWAAAGLAVLSRGFRSPRVLVEAYRRPQPPYPSGPAAARAGATAMIDISDGLVADAGHIAAASGVSIDLDPAALPVADELRSAAAAFNADPLAWVLTGGDDHALLATFPAGQALPDEFQRLGQVLPADRAPVLLAGQPWTEEDGFEHFR
jgi:thiamine-monophosphate kinase